MAAKKNKIDFSHKYNKSSHVIWKEKDADSVTVMHLKRHEHFYSITGVAVQLWKKLDGRRTVEENLAQLSKRNKVPADSLRPKASKFLQDLLNEELITRAK